MSLLWQGSAAYLLPIVHLLGLSCAGVVVAAELAVMASSCT